MVLIQSSISDASTGDVMDWFRFLFPETNLSRFDDNTTIKKISHSISNNGEKLKIESDNNSEINTDDVKAWWYRRGFWEFKSLPVNISDKTHFKLSTTVSSYLESEYKTLEESIDYSLTRLTKHINNYSNNGTNKISNLSLASSLGLKIPDTLITNDIEELGDFSAKYQAIITKPLSKNIFKVNFEHNLLAYISCNITLITETDLRILANIYKKTDAMPACYQEYIEKAYELRIFFLNDKLYPMAIFSQANEKTRLDFRNYDSERPNRCVPYNLPQLISTQILSLMHTLEMNSGSIDMIVTPQQDYVFLEVNPIGKYQWLRQNCNYTIDQDIARFLNS